MQAKFLILVVFLAIAFVFLAAAASIPNSNIPLGIAKIILLLVGIAFSILAFASRYYTYLIIPMFQQHSRHLVLSSENAYWLSSSNDAILHKEGEDFVATVIVNIPLYVSSTEMSGEEKLNFAAQVGRLSSITSYPMRITSQLYVMNKDSYIQQLRDTISTMENKEAQLTQEGAPQGEISKVHGALAMWKKMLDNVSKNMSLELATFATISAKGTKEYEAVNAVHQKAMEIMSGIGATLGVSPNLVIGNDILKFIEPEFLIPYSTVSEQITKNIQEEVI
ncbi:MAG: hypothetical protein M1360_00905 [Candidatus Marsarchaeota archaeon]|jgi:hypothetical protein|nr:hypothetical protein [Candidatus Marsarchaeota archaeon]MCL5418485.1 hypothetical protein [Candidatus Marsarchaeota archaeon]